MLANLEQIDDRAVRSQLIIEACALRFRGYDWANAQASAPEGGVLQANLERFLSEWRFFPENEQNLGVFFYIQRTLRHWGQGMFELRQEPLVFGAAFLFLELRHVPVRRQWQNRDIMPQWKRLSPEQIEDAAAFARGWLVSAALPARA